EADGAHWLFGLQVHDHPLRMQCVTLAREFACQIRVALPVGQVRTLYRTIAAGRESAVGQGIGENVPNGFLEVGRAGEISAAMRGITPGTILGPMPGGHPELGVVAVGDRSAAG